MPYLTIEQIKQITKGDYLYIVVLANKASSFYIQIDSIDDNAVLGVDIAERKRKA